MTADEVQERAEEQCRRQHGGQCIAWGQAVVLFNHCFGAVAESDMARNTQGCAN